jgi:transcriptional regulator with XRE-family HTH domain
VPVSNRTRRADEAGRAGERLEEKLGRELRLARLTSGLRQSDVARVLGVSHTSIGRVERGIASLGIADASRHAAVVGLRLYARFYPTGSGLRDAAQLDLLRRFHSRIGDRWTWQLEAPLNIAGDPRAFDALLTRPPTPSSPTLTVAVEAVTRLRDAQAQLRAANLKQRDGGAQRLVILLSASHANRTALRSAADILATTFPLGTKATLTGLAAGIDPGANGIVLL